MPTSMRKALDIPEILETILIELPPLDLIIVQQVSKTFKAVIENSVEIRYKTFFKQRPKRTDGKAALNPFLRHILERCGHLVSIVVYEDAPNATYYLHRLIGRSNFTQSSNEHLVPATGSILISIDRLKDSSVSYGARSASYTTMKIADTQIHVDVEIGETKPLTVRGDTLGAIMEACSRQAECLRDC